MKKQDPENSTATTEQENVVGESTSYFNLPELRLPQNFQEQTGVKKLLTSVPVRRPDPLEFFRVHPDENMRFVTAILENKLERETYIVHPSLHEQLAGILVPKILYLTINRHGVLKIWAIRLPDEHNRLDKWNQSALEAAALGMKKWIRISSNFDLGAYEIYEAQGHIPDPEWPQITFEKILNIAFKGKIIDTLDHPILRALRGE